MADRPFRHARPTQKLPEQSWEIADPGLWAFTPVIGPAWEAAYDVQQGDYGSALFNGVTAIAEASPIAPAIRIAKLVKAVRRGDEIMASANAMRKRFKAQGLIKDGEELHHTIPLNGASRYLKGDFRNHPALLKPLAKEKHRRLTGSWVVEGVRKQQYGPIGKAWHGTTDYQKAVPVASAAVAIDGEVEVGNNRRRR